MKFILSVFLIALALSANAAQTFRVKDGDTITVKISSRDITRIAIEGEGKLDDIKVAAGLLDIVPDLEKGEVTVRPLGGAPAVFSFLLTDDLGATYTLVAEQHDVPTETVLLRIDNSKRSRDQEGERRTDPYVESVKQLMKGMALNKTPDGFTLDDIQVKVPLWKETNIVMTQTYTGYELLGEVYQIQNVSKEEIIFSEKEFFEFGENVRAVAMEQLQLDAGATTYLYVVRSKGGF